MNPPTQILAQFKPLFTDDFIYYIYYGGRGGGKSEGIAQSLVILSTLKKHRILCIREVQQSIQDSSKALIEKWIEQLGLQNLFIIRRDEIECINGSMFIFKGLKNSNAVNIKSISGITMTWVEEAEAISKKSWELLVPSVTRTHKPKIIVSFNPQFEDDIIYERFLVQTPPPSSFICKINYWDNPHFKKTNLEEQRKHDKFILPPSEYLYKWEGALLGHQESALWTKETLDKLIYDIPYERSNYVQLIIAVDPAATSTTHSNEYGICVMGLTSSGLIDLIEDAGGVYTPHQFGLKVVELYDFYNADCSVVESNQGGEHVRQTLLTLKETMNYESVWSSSDKITRAMPVATLGAAGRIRHIEGGAKALERQLRLMTSRGYLGPKGSSPDRVDAYVWGVSFLAGLKQSRAEQTLFTISMFKRDENFNFLERNNQGIVTILGGEACILKYSVYSRENLAIILLVEDCIILEPSDAFNALLAMEFTYVLIPDIAQTQNWNILGGSYYENFHKSLDELVLETIGILRENKIQLRERMPSRTFKNESGELLKVRLLKFMLDEKIKDSAVQALCYLAKNYF